MSPLESPDLLFTDTETTGLLLGVDEVLSVSFIDGAGTVLLSTRVRPVRHTSWPAAQAIHGIRPEDVLRPDLPTLAELAPRIAGLTRGRHLIAYNAVFDCGMLADALALGPPAKISCAMDEFAEYWGSWSDYHQNYAFQSLQVAADYVLHSWQGTAHGSLADSFAARGVWEYVHWPALREAVAEEKARRREEFYAQAEVQRFLAARHQLAETHHQQLNAAWTAAYYQRVPTLRPQSIYAPQEARAAADAMSRHLTGYPVQTWNAYGKKLKLRRYVSPPPHLAREGAGGVHFLRLTWRPANEPQLSAKPGPPIEPVAMQVLPSAGDELNLAPLFDLRKLTPGVDYVPFALKWPEGHCTATDLQRKYKLKPADIARLRPAYLRRGLYQHYFLYLAPLPAEAPSPSITHAICSPSS